MTSDLYDTSQQTRHARALLVMVVALTVMVLFVFSRGRPFNSKTLALMMNDAGCLCSMLMVLGLPVPWLISQRWPTGEAYAVTNERMLYRNRHTVITLPLEKLPHIQMFVGREKKGWLIFEGGLAWRDIEDVSYVNQLISEAQQRRLQDPES
jgi:hypothetical protein